MSGFVMGILVVLLIGAGVPVGAAPATEGMEITVYNKDLGLVTERRFMDIKGGVSDVRYEGIAALIDPTSLQFSSLGNPRDCRILEQSYEYDLVSDQALLERYKGMTITVVTEDSTLYEGKLLSGGARDVVTPYGGAAYLPGGGSIILQSADGRVVNVRLDKVREIRYPSLPEGLITRPTMVWKVDNRRAGRHLTEVRYLTRGIEWKADYVATLGADEKNMDITGWVTLNNRSGGTYRDARLKLMAGDLNMVSDMNPQVEMAYVRKAMVADALAAPFEEKSFFEYHLYTMQRPTTIKDNEVKQVELLSAARVPVRKLYYYDGGRGRYTTGSPRFAPAGANKKVNVIVELTNNDKNGLGMPLPAGKVRLNKADSDNSLQFIGEDSIDHTPKDEKLRLYVGDAFDIVGERIQTETRRLSDKMLEETWKIKLRNHKDTPVTVNVVEHFDRYSDWEIMRSSLPFEKTDARTIVFPVNILPDKEAVVEYTVRYKW